MSKRSASYGGGVPHEQGQISIKVNPDLALIASIKLVDPNGTRRPVYGYQDSEAVHNIAVGDILVIYRGKDRRDIPYMYDGRGPIGKQKEARVVAALNGIGAGIREAHRHLPEEDLGKVLGKRVVPIGVAKTEWRSGDSDNNPLVCAISGTDDFRAYYDFTAGDRVRFVPIPWNIWHDSARVPEKGHEHFKAPMIVAPVNQQSFKTEFVEFVTKRIDSVGANNSTEKHMAWESMFLALYDLVAVAFVAGVQAYDSDADDADAQKADREAFSISVAAGLGLSTKDRKPGNEDGTKKILKQIFWDGVSGDRALGGDNPAAGSEEFRLNLAHQNAWKKVGPGLFEAFREFTYGNGSGMAVTSTKSGANRYVRVHYDFA